MGVQAVSTTGIYCRPECSARPLPENVSDFPSAVAAEAAGYRSCLRCRPDRFNRPDEAAGAPPPVATAMRLISDGYLDRHDEMALAARVGYSTRQLRRLFDQHVGASPAFVARSRRAHFARRLLDESELPMPAVARASGFGSMRQMNRVIHDIFGFGPQELRSKRRPTDILVADGGLRLRLPFLEPLDRAAALAHVEPRATPGVEAVQNGTYRRTLAVCGNPGVIEVDLSGSEAHLELLAHLPTFDSIIDDVSRIRQMFGLDDNVESAESHLAADPLMAELIASQRGLRVIGGWDRFETAVRVIVGQQISVAGASTIAGRIVAARGMPLPGAALGLRFVFPTADRLTDLDSADLGMPRSRVRTIETLAAAVTRGEVDLHATDPDGLRRQLLDLPGIGPWTAELICMRALRDADAFPSGDLGIRHAVGALTGTAGPADAAEVAALAERWRPFRALAAQHLWTGLSRRKELT
jgi:AraC family transcriptional regulator of adaptative response / DNA-3-methyladenine glycosylase II